MITEQFLEEKEIISPKCFYGEREKLLDVCIITFSYIIFSSAKDMEGSKVIATVPSAGGNYEIIKLDVKEKRVGIFLSPVGAPAAGGLLPGGGRTRGGYPNRAAAGDPSAADRCPW